MPPQNIAISHQFPSPFPSPSPSPFPSPSPSPFPFPSPSPSPSPPLSCSILFFRGEEGLWADSPERKRKHSRFQYLRTYSPRYMIECRSKGFFFFFLNLMSSKGREARNAERCLQGFRFVGKGEIRQTTTGPHRASSARVISARLIV